MRAIARIPIDGYFLLHEESSLYTPYGASAGSLDETCYALQERLLGDHVVHRPDIIHRATVSHNNEWVLLYDVLPERVHNNLGERLLSPHEPLLLVNEKEIRDGKGRGGHRLDDVTRLLIDSY